MVRGKLGVEYAVAEGKAVDNGSGGGNGTAFGICAAISFAEALFFALAPHSVGILAWIIAASIVNTCHVHRAFDFCAAVPEHAQDSTSWWHAVVSCSILLINL